MNSVTQSEFKSKVLKCIDAGLDALGEVSKQVVYMFLARNQGLDKEKIADNPAKLAETLGSLFGQGGAVLERTIVSELKRAFNVTANVGRIVDVMGVIGSGGYRSTARLTPGQAPASHHPV